MSDSNRPVTVRELIAHLQTLPPDTLVLENEHSDTIPITAELLEFIVPTRVIDRGSYFEEPGQAFDAIHKTWYSPTDEEMCNYFNTSLDKILKAVVL